MLGYVIFAALPALLTAGWLFYNVWPKQSLRMMRDQLFEVRDDLFALASSSDELEFEDVAYGMLRANINGYIRFGETISILSIVKLSQTPPPQGLRPWNERWNEYLEECSPEVADQLRLLHMRALIEVFKHAIRTSLIAQAMLAFKRLSNRLRAPMDAVLDKFRSPVESAGEAYAEEHVAACMTIHVAR